MPRVRDIRAAPRIPRDRDAGTGSRIPRDRDAGTGSRIPRDRDAAEEPWLTRLRADAEVEVEFDPTETPRSPVAPATDEAEEPYPDRPWRIDPAQLTTETFWPDYDPRKTGLRQESDPPAAARPFSAEPSPQPYEPSPRPHSARLYLAPPEQPQPSYPPSPEGFPGRPPVGEPDPRDPVYLVDPYDTPAPQFPYPDAPSRHAYGTGGYRTVPPPDPAGTAPRSPYPPERRYRSSEPTRPRSRADRVTVPRADDDEEEEVDTSLAPSLRWTVGWFAIPAMVYVLWSLTLAGAASADCVDSAGNPCKAPRTEALTRFVDTLPYVVVAVALALLVAVALRRVCVLWRHATVGFAAAVVGAGVATIIGSSL